MLFLTKELVPNIQTCFFVKSAWKIFSLCYEVVAQGLLFHYSPNYSEVRKIEQPLSARVRTSRTVDFVVKQNSCSSHPTRRYSAFYYIFMHLYRKNSVIFSVFTNTLLDLLPKGARHISENWCLNLLLEFGVWFHSCRGKWLDQCLATFLLWRNSWNNFLYPEKPVPRKTFTYQRKMQWTADWNYCSIYKCRKKYP
jgi:hypothetical protein